MNLRGRVAIVTGASSGIGLELSRQLAGKGCRVVMAARNLAAMESAAAEIRAGGGEALAVKTDVRSRADTENLVKAALEAFGRIDLYVTNAGISQGTGVLTELSEDDVRATMETNFMAAVYGVWAAAPAMERTGGGLMVFVTSIVGKRGVPRSSIYCASKFAVQGLTESIRPELHRKNIRVVSVCPPGVDTPFFEKNGRGGRRRFRLHPVRKIAAMIVRACELETREALLTIDSKLIYWANVFVPRLVDWAAAKNKGV